jgi:hypothetical protein
VPVYHRLLKGGEDWNEYCKQGKLCGGPPRGIYRSDIPKAKAYAGSLPIGQKGVEFTTDVTPDPYGHPCQPTWSGNRPGVVTDTYKEIACVRITCTKIVT